LDKIWPREKLFTEYAAGSSVADGKVRTTEIRGGFMHIWHVQCYLLKPQHYEVTTEPGVKKNIFHSENELALCLWELGTRVYLW